MLLTLTWPGEELLTRPLKTFKADTILKLLPKISLFSIFREVGIHPCFNGRTSIT